MGELKKKLERLGLATQEGKWHGSPKRVRPKPDPFVVTVTDHYIMRAEERLGLKEKLARYEANAAWHHGKRLVEGPKTIVDYMRNLFIFQVEELFFKVEGRPKQIVVKTVYDNARATQYLKSEAYKELFEAAQVRQELEKPRKDCEARVLPKDLHPEDCICQGACLAEEGAGRYSKASAEAKKQVHPPFANHRGANAAAA